MKNVVLGAALLICGSQASAVFVSATWQPPGNDLEQSFARLQATARGGIGEEQTLRPLPLPYNGPMAANAIRPGDPAYAQIEAVYNLGPAALQVDVTKLVRAGLGGAGSDGAWIFSVTEAVSTAASGFLDTHTSAYFNENYLRATLYDLTANLRLFESNQEDHATGVVYNLGGLVGNRAASFVGTLNNVLLPSHVYRLTYALGVSNPEAGADNSFATGSIMLLAQPVPEPATYALFGLGLFAVLAAAQKSRSRPANPSDH